MALDETIARGTYRGAVRAMTQMTPDAVIDEVIQSGLRGRGGAAFPTGQKWRLARQAAGRHQVRGLQRRRRRARAPTWTGRSWKAIPTRSSKACSSARTRSAPARASSTSAASIRWPSRSSNTPSTEAEKRGLLGDEHPRQRLVVPRHGPPRGGGLHLRRGDGPDRIARRPFRRAAHAAARIRSPAACGASRPWSTT